MATSIRFKIAEKYQDRDDLLKDYNYGFVEKFQSGLPSTSEKELDRMIKSALKYIHGTRDEMHELVMTDSVGPDDIADLVEEARAVYKAATFKVRRYYLVQEESLPHRCKSEAREVETEDQHTKPLDYILWRGRQLFHSKAFFGAMALKRAKRSRLSVLEEAMIKVERHELLALMEEGRRPF